MENYTQSNLYVEIVCVLMIACMNRDPVSFVGGGKGNGISYPPHPKIDIICLHLAAFEH